MEENHVLASYESYKNKFNTDAAAKNYSTRHVQGRKNRQEKTCIQQSLMTVDKNSLVLDLPCGTGRHSAFLESLGFRVVGADYSNHMISYAKKLNAGTNIVFEQQDVMAIKHPDKTFKATLCNRLFHHYTHSETRRQALKELSRVTEGVIVVSFFNSFSLSAIYSFFKNIIKNKKSKDRTAISYFTFKKDIEAAGLKIIDSYYCQFGLSPQTYLKLVKI